MAPQALEKDESAPEDELALEALDAEDTAERLRTALTSRLAAAQPQTPPGVRGAERPAGRAAANPGKDGIRDRERCRPGGRGCGGEAPD